MSGLCVFGIDDGLINEISFPRNEKNLAVSNSCFSGGVLSCEISIFPVIPFDVLNVKLMLS